MKERILLYISLFGISLLLLVSCLKEEEYPIVPEIEYEEFLSLVNKETGVAEKGVLKFSFKDGDGDVGLGQGDQDPPYDYNLFISLYEIQNGDSVEIEPALTLNQRIPLLTPEGKQKAIRGEIEDTLFINDPTSDYDTIFLEFYILDRALNQSNTISTPLILRKFPL